jgi:hypothetical protein
VRLGTHQRITLEELDCAEYVWASIQARAEQGLAVTITDPETLDRAALLFRAEND